MRRAHLAEEVPERQRRRRSRLDDLVGFCVRRSVEADGAEDLLLQRGKMRRNARAAPAFVLNWKLSTVSMMALKPPPATSGAFASPNSR